MSKKQIRILLVLLAAIAAGVNWTAYESHVANLGVQAMASALSSAAASIQCPSPGARTRRPLPTGERY